MLNVFYKLWLNCNTVFSAAFSVPLFSIDPVWCRSRSTMLVDTISNLLQPQTTRTLLDHTRRQNSFPPSICISWLLITSGVH